MARARWLGRARAALRPPDGAKSHVASGTGWGAVGSRGVPRAQACVGVRHAAAPRPAAASREMGAQVRWRSRGAGWSWPARGPRVPRLLRLPPTRLLPSQHSRHARLYLRHRRRLRPRHRRRHRGPQPPHPPRACVARDRASARPFHDGSSAFRSRLRGCAGLRSAHRRRSARGTSYGRSALGPAQPRTAVGLSAPTPV